MRTILEQLRSREDLSPAQVEKAVEILVSPEESAETKCDFLRTLREKGETAGEIAAFVRALLRHAVDPQIDQDSVDQPMIDVCGTGGDRMDLFNVSTASMFVVAGAGAAVVKHGNRGITSRCGGADVLEALGVRIDLPPSQVEHCVAETGAAFLFAQAYHPAFKAIAPIRKQLATEGISTVFNILGPLLNPAQPRYQLLGVFDRRFLPKLAATLKLLGRERAWVVHGQAPGGRGMDELSTMGPTEVAEVTRNDSREFSVDAHEFDFVRSTPEELRGSDAASNAKIIEGILDGTISDARRDVVAWNAAAAIAVSGLTPDLAEAVTLSRSVLQDGRGKTVLERLRKFSAEQQ